MFVVTGASGFIGSALVWHLNKRGHKDIICVDHFRSGSKWKNLSKRSFLHFVYPENLFEFLEQPDVEDALKAIFHLGACSSTTETNMDYLVHTNYYFSQKLFKWCAKHKKKFIYASSAAVYGNGQKGFDDKTDSFDLNPLNPYGYSKVLFDRWVQITQHRPSQWVGLKFFNVYGPQEYHKNDQASVVFKAFNQIRENRNLALFKSYDAKYENGKQMRDFVYVKDVVRWMLEIFEKPDINGIFNMGFGKARTWLDLADGVFSNMNEKKKIKWINMPPEIQSQYQYFTEAKMDKLLSLGLSKPEWSLEKGIADYVKNYLLKPDSYL